jgi:hypothetical protein
MIQIPNLLNDSIVKPKLSLINIEHVITKKVEQTEPKQLQKMEQAETKQLQKMEQTEPKQLQKMEQAETKQLQKVEKEEQAKEKKKDNMYKPKQKDSLFWCFYILKHGFFNYEMEINNQYFVIEKNEKFRYINLLRNNKDLLKIHKIKPFTELEDDLAHKDKISIKTFVALCLLENINFLLVNKCKFYEFLCTDNNPIHIIHRNNDSYEHSIELDTSEEIIKKYRDNYFKLSSFDTKLKSISSYKLEELIILCKKLDINLDIHSNSTEGKKKLSKKDIYELLVLKY